MAACTWYSNTPGAAAAMAATWPRPETSLAYCMSLTSPLAFSARQKLRESSKRLRSALKGWSSLRSSLAPLASV
jgi:hypothetical protein